MHTHPIRPETTPSAVHDAAPTGPSTPDSARACPSSTGTNHDHPAPRAAHSTPGQVPPAPGAASRPRIYSASIDGLVRDITVEFHDRAHMTSNCTQARTLWQASGLEQEDFVELLYMARTIVRQRGNIQKSATDDASGGFVGLKNKMPYFFAIVRNELRPRRAKRTSAHGQGDRIPAAGRGVLR